MYCVATETLEQNLTESFIIFLSMEESVKHKHISKMQISL